MGAIVVSKTARMAQTLNGAPPGEGEIEFSDPVKVAYTSAQSQMEIVAVGGVTYVKAVAGTSTKPWFKLDPKATDAYSKSMSAVNDVSRSVDPRLMVSMMDGVVGQGLGTEEVGGVPTEHYTFQIPFSGVSKMLSPEVLKVMQAMVKQGTLKMPMAADYWVGNDNLPRRLAIVMEVSGQKQTTEATFSDWGKPVNIVAPPAAQVGPRPGS
jgi:hypothetical protein